MLREAICFEIRVRSNSTRSLRLRRETNGRRMERAVYFALIVQSNWNGAWSQCSRRDMDSVSWGNLYVGRLTLDSIGINEVREHTRYRTIFRCLSTMSKVDVVCIAGARVLPLWSNLCFEKILWEQNRDANEEKSHNAHDSERFDVHSVSFHVPLIIAKKLNCPTSQKNPRTINRTLHTDPDVNLMILENILSN